MNNSLPIDQLDIESLLNDDATTYRVVDLDISLIDEDPDQPRQTFDSATIEELADSIRARGLKTPISVRPSLTTPGRYVINHGARRFRAVKLTEQKTIRSEIDEDYTAEDQLIENLQREDLKPLEIASFLAKLCKDKQQQDVAKLLGKTKGWVSQHLTLLKLPKPIFKLLEKGVCKDVTVLNDIFTMYKKYPDTIERHIKEEKEITRSQWRHYKEFLEEEKARLFKEQDTSVSTDAGAQQGSTLPSQNEGSSSRLSGKEESDSKQSEKRSKSPGEFETKDHTDDPEKQTDRGGYPSSAEFPQGEMSAGDHSTTSSAPSSNSSNPQDLEPAASSSEGEVADDHFETASDGPYLVIDDSVWLSTELPDKATTDGKIIRISDLHWLMGDKWEPVPPGSKS